MAAVTINSERVSVEGNNRVIYGNVDIAADGDTYNTRLKGIDWFNALGSGGNVIDGTISGGTITFNTVGAETGVRVKVSGR